MPDVDRFISFRCNSNVVGGKPYPSPIGPFPVYYIAVVCAYICTGQQSVFSISNATDPNDWLVKISKAHYCLVRVAFM